MDAKYGEVLIESVIPSVRTVSRHLNDVVDLERSKLKKELMLVRKFGVTCDGWTHENTNIKYFTITIQFVDKNFVLRSKILATRPVEDNTANTTKLHVSSVLNEFGANHDSNINITDNASAMKAAFKNETWLSCACHNLNLVLSHGFQRSKEKNNSDAATYLPEEVAELVENC